MPEPFVSPEKFESAKLTQWRLPKALEEISGLATIRNDRLFAHDDEHAVIYELDYVRGKIVKRFALGEPIVRGDFEGITVANDLFYLVTSSGDIHVAREVADKHHADYEVYKTGLGKMCEVEGLTHDPYTHVLLLACKKSHDTKAVKIYVWSIEKKQLLVDDTVTVSRKDIKKMSNLERFNPSAIVFDRKTRHLLIVAARQRAIMEVDENGRPQAVFSLPSASRHEQPEGIALTSDRKILIADEAKKGGGSLSIYEMRKP